MQPELTQQIFNLHRGDHLCLFYDQDPAEQMPALVPFIQDGLARDEQFIYIADDQTVEELADQLERSGVNVAIESDRGALKLWTRHEWRQPGRLSAQKKRLQVLAFINEALKSGFNGVRFSIEMTWTLGPDIGVSELEHWEAALNNIFYPGFPGRITCQYNRSRLSPDVMLAALHTHPLAIIGDHVYPNWFYEAPLILDGNANGHSSAAKVEWMVSQLKRARDAERERERLEEQLRHAQKMESIGTLAGGIAHDFNNILNIIKSCASLIGRRPSIDPTVAETLQDIHETVDRGASMVRQLLTLARKTETRMVLTDVNEVVADLSKLLKQTLPKTIDIVAELTAPLPRALSDPTQINQALLNLCVNARDAMPAGGKLMLRTTLTGDKNPPNGANNGVPYVCLEVADTGVGIEPTIKGRIFEPFFTTKKVGQGTGLGLAIVYGIVKDHNGHIEVESEPERGASFRVYLPTAIAEQELKAGSNGDSAVLRRSKTRGTILLAEDEKFMVRLLRNTLSQHGYEIFVATDGEEAITLYRRHKHQIQVVLLDIGLPKVAGWDVMLRMKDENPRVNIVVTSGYIEPELKTRFIQAGVRHFIDKPYTAEAIIEKLQELIPDFGSAAALP
jgi:two-component system cell cycle sensor histidine kinase/response regulator CckA